MKLHIQWISGKWLPKMSSLSDHLHEVVAYKSLLLGQKLASLAYGNFGNLPHAAIRCSVLYV